MEDNTNANRCKSGPLKNKRDQPVGEEIALLVLLQVFVFFKEQLPSNSFVEDQRFYLRPFLLLAYRGKVTTIMSYDSVLQPSWLMTIISKNFHGHIATLHRRDQSSI